MEASESLSMKEKSGISGSTIKMIAMVAMVIDHVAATILERMMVQNEIGLFGSEGVGDPLPVIYLIMRLIGRLSFPVFVFLLVEGVEHTHDRWKYLKRMVLFALISEMPFDFALGLSNAEIMDGKIIEFSHQNVFFTLAIGLLTIIGIQSVEATEWKKAGKVFMKSGIAIAGIALAALLRTDYGAFGVLAIVVMYLLRKKRMKAVAVTCVVLTVFDFLEISSFLILLPIRFYNGKRGWSLKWVFYVFYPAHLFLLWLICLAMGIG